MDLPSTAPRHREGITWAYGMTRVRIGDNPDAVQFDCEPGCALVIDDTRYELRQFRLHAPSEHTFEGRHAPMSLHLLHEADDGRLAVVAVMLESDRFHPALAGAFALHATHPTLSQPFEPETLLPADRTFVAYEGSLTSPPFTEGVAWRVLTRPIELSTAQIDAFRALHRDNNRSLQPLGDRGFE